MAGAALGILAADQGWLPPVGGVALGGFALLAGAFAVSGTITGARLAFAAAVAIGVAAGGWRFDAVASSSLDSGPSLAGLVDGADHDLVGTVADDPRPRQDRLQLVLTDVSADIAGVPTPMSDGLVAWTPRGLDIGSGDRVWLRSRLELPEDFDGFAYREYLARQNVSVIGRPRDVRLVSRAAGAQAILYGTRRALLDGLNSLVPEPEAALGAGILLGVRAAIAPEISDAFAVAGLTHVVAISGWNIAIVTALVAAAVRPLEAGPGGRWTTALIAAAVVGAYVLLTGASPSVVRAALMAAAMLIARLGGSRAHAASALGVAALAMLLVAPAVLWDVGFQLSLLATGGLIWFGASIERRLPGWPGWIREPVALTLAAQLTTLPVILVNFERLSLVAPLANVLVVPFVPVAMLFGAIASAVGMLDGVVHLSLVGDLAGWLAGGAEWLTLRVIIVLGSLMASVPLAAVDVSLPPLVAAAWLPVLGLASWAMSAPSTDPVEEPMRSGRDGPPTVIARVARPAPITAFLVAVLVAVTLGSRPDGRLHITVLDIGQGDAILVEAPTGATMLLDGGPDPELTLRRIGANLPYFARRIDVLVLSHPHQDHVAGLVDALHRHRVGLLLHAGIEFENPANDRLLADAAARGVAVQTVTAGNLIRLDPTTSIEVIYPTAADVASPLPDGDINNGSLVIVLRHGAFSALLTGDAEAPVEERLAARGVLPVADMLKVGHHGSTSSTSEILLSRVDPYVAVISSGAGNEYGHPAPETLAALAARPAIEVYRTDLQGDIELVTDGSRFMVRTDAGWSTSRAVHGSGVAGSIGPWPYPIDSPRGGCSTRRACPPASSAIPRGWPALPAPRRHCWPRRRSRSTARWWRPRRCSTTSTRSRSDAPAASMESWAPDGSRQRGTRSSRSRSPPIPSPRCWMTIDFRSAGHRSWWRSRTATSRRTSSPSTSAWTT